MIKILTHATTLFLTSIILCTNTFADVIDLDCKVKRWGDQWEKFLSETKNDTSSFARILKPIPHKKKWWEALQPNYDDEMYFSIDTLHQKAIYPNDDSNSNNLIFVSPYQFIIETFLQCNAPNIIQCQGLMYTYDINRITGEISGSYSAADNSFLPYFKEGDIIYSFTGSCEPIERKF